MIQELIKRYEQRIHNNQFEQNPYYPNPYAERKEVIEKLNELKLKLTK